MENSECSHGSSDGGGGGGDGVPLPSTAGMGGWVRACMRECVCVCVCVCVFRPLTIHESAVYTDGTLVNAFR